MSRRPLQGGCPDNRYKRWFWLNRCRAGATFFCHRMRPPWHWNTNYNGAETVSKTRGRSTMRILLCQTVLIFFAPTLVRSCPAQDDPFGAPTGKLFEEPPSGAAGASEESDEPPSLLVQQLRQFAVRGNMQLAESVSSFARIGQWAEVDRMLLIAESRNIPAAEMAKMARQIGPSILLRIEIQEGISDQARAALKTIGDAATAASGSPDALRSAIDGLDAESIDNRLASIRLILSGGNAAIAELVAAAVSEQPSAPVDDILRTMLRLGDGGSLGLRQLALYGKPAVRLRAIEALVRIDRNSAIREMATTLHAADSTADEVALVEGVLRKLTSSLPTRAQTVEMLLSELQQHRDIASQIDHDRQERIVWSVDETRSRVTYRASLLIMAAYRDAADSASRLRRIGGLTAAVQRASLLADIGYQVMVDPDWGDPNQIQSVRAAFGPATVGPELSDAIGESLDRNDQPALVGLLKLIDPNSLASDRNELIRSSGAVPTPLVQASSSLEPRIRYEATSAIVRLAGGIAYSGSSRVRASLGEMRSLKDQPTAILVETRAGVIVQQETLLRQLGYDVEVVGSVAALQRRVARGGDLRMILSKTELADMTAIEMIDVVRRLNRGREVPIVFYGAEVIGLQSNRWAAVTVLVNRPASTAAFHAAITETKRRRRLPQLTAIDRQMYRETAAEMLSELAQLR